MREQRSQAGTQVRFQVLHEIAEEACARLPRNIWDYMRGATETETTAKRNRLAIDALRLGRGAAFSKSSHGQRLGRCACQLLLAEMTSSTCAVRSVSLDAVSMCV